MTPPTYQELYAAIDSCRREVLAEVKALTSEVRSWQAIHSAEHDRGRWRAWRAAGSVSVLMVALASVIVTVLIRGGW